MKRDAASPGTAYPLPGEPDWMAKYLSMPPSCDTVIDEHGNGVSVDRVTGRKMYFIEETVEWPDWPPVIP